MYALALVVVSVATLGQTVFGFGGGLISIPPLSLIVGVQNGVTLALILQLVSGLLLWPIRHELTWASVKIVAGGLVVGTASGLYLLSQANEASLRLLLAIFIIYYLVKYQFFDDVPLPWLKKPAGGLVMGLVAGVLQGLIGSGGPPVVIYLREIGRDKSALRAQLLLLLFLSNCLRLPLSIAAGLFNVVVLRICIAAIPCFVAAMYVGHKLHARMSEKHYHLAIRIVLVASAVSLIIRSLQSIVMNDASS